MLMSISMAIRTDIKGAEGHPHVRDSPNVCGWSEQPLPQGPGHVHSTHDNHEHH